MYISMKPILLAVALLAAAAAAGFGAPLRDASGACVWLPPDSPLRRDVSLLPVHPDSDNIIKAISGSKAPADAMLHPDFGGGEDKGKSRILYGIPFNKVDTSKGDPFNAIKFDEWPEESDPGPYPFKPGALTEGSYPGCSNKVCDGDRHIIAVDQATCILYEASACKEPDVDAKGFVCANGAKFNLSNSTMPQRTLGWTSADAAGLPVAPLLVRVDEIRAGEITHAIRFTSWNSLDGYIRPAAHKAGHGDTGPHSPPMGTSARLKAAFDCETRLDTRAARVICRAMKKYGLILADNGTPWYFSGEASSAWEATDDPELIPDLDAFNDDIKRIRGGDFEIVDTGACVCTNAECTNCGETPPPQPPPSPPPSGGGSPTVVLRRGLAAVRADGSTGPAYDQVMEAAITDDGAPAAPNGRTTFWPRHDRLHLQEAPGAAFSSRALLWFGGLDAYVPAKKVVLDAVSLNLTVNNTGSTPLEVEGYLLKQVEGYLLKQAWKGTNESGADRSLGWVVRRPNPSKPTSGKPQKWSTPGAWPKSRVPDALWFSVPAGTGVPTTVKVDLPMKLVKKWLASKGKSNYGLLLKLIPGSTGAADVTSSLSGDEAARPALTIVYDKQ